MEHLILKYGKDEVSFDLDGARSINYLSEKEVPEIDDLHEEFMDSITSNCINSKPLNGIIEKDDLVTIVVSDITRFWMRQDLICMELVNYLNKVCKVPFENIVILIALGTHRAQSEMEMRKIVSEEVFEKVKVLNHDCMADDLVYLGTTGRRIDVIVNPLAVNRKLILTGGTVNHLMSGFGGGRKSVLPGISSKQTINNNHLLSLDPNEPKAKPLIGMVSLENNPLHLDMMEACEIVNPSFSMNIVSNANSKHVKLFSGNWKDALLKSCDFVRDNFGIKIEKKFDVVIGSCGGFPKDINFYQAVKALLNMSQAVKDGGEMIFIAECIDGGGAPDFFDWRKSLITNSLDKDLRENFTIAGYIFYACCEAILKCNVTMLTNIEPSILKEMKIKAYNSLDELKSNIDFKGKEVCIMKNGGSVVPYI